MTRDTRGRRRRAFVGAATAVAAVVLSLQMQSTPEHATAATEAGNFQPAALGSESDTGRREFPADAPKGEEPPLTGDDGAACREYMDAVTNYQAKKTDKAAFGAAKDQAKSKAATKGMRDALDRLAQGAEEIGCPPEPTTAGTQS